MKENLDTYVTAYMDSNKYTLDNKLILNFYPQRVLSKMEGDSMLELGLGHGYSTMNFAKNLERYVVIEGSDEVIKLFNSKFDISNLEIIQTYFEDFVTNEKFDNIMMGFILEHVNDPSFIINKYKRFLNKNGKIFITVPNSEALNRRIGLKAGLLKNLKYLSEFDKNQGHKRYFDKQTINKLLLDNNLNISSIEGLFLKPITTEQILQLNLSPKILHAMLEVGIEYPELCTALLIEARL